MKNSVLFKIVKLAEQNRSISAARMKKIRAFKYMLSEPGRMAIKMIFRTFMVMPEAPFPNITAPIYFSGRIEAIPKT